MIGGIDRTTQQMQSPVVINNSTSQIDFSFAVDAKDKPSQVSLLVGVPEQDLEVVLEPKITEAGELIMYKFTIDESTIPAALLHLAQVDQDLLTVSVVLARPDEYKNNVLASVFKIQVDLDRAVEYKRPARLGVKKQIIHEFNPEPKTVPWRVAQFFVFLITLVTFGLVVAWMSSGALNFNNVPTNFNIVYLLSFVFSIIGFEFIFVQYYAGKSIFETLFAALYLALPSLWLGTKFLRNFGERI